MKIQRKLLGACLILSLSAPALAIEIVGGKLISHQESTTDYGTAAFQDLKIKINIQPKWGNKSSTLNEWFVTTTHALPVSPIIPHTNANLSGDHAFAIQNSSAFTKIYGIHIVICENKILPDGMMQFDHCADTSYEIELDPQGFSKSHLRSDLSIKLDNPKINYIEYVGTVIDNVSDNTEYNSEDTQPITFTSTPPLETKKE